MANRSQTTLRKSRNSGGSGKSVSPPLIDIIIDSAKKAFENDMRERKTSSTASSSPGSSSKPTTKNEDKKSVSAPASPNKSLTVMLPSNDQPPAAKRARLRSSMSPKAKSSLLLTTSSTSTTTTASATETSQSDKSKSLLSDKSKKSSKHGGISMTEVIRLHQDEGVMHLLHGLNGKTRRRPSTSQVVSVSHTSRRRPSSEMERVPNKKGMAQGVCKANTSALRTVLTQRLNNIENVLSAPLSPNIKPTTQEELMTPTNMEILKQLPTKDYVKLWSSPGRYLLSQDRVRIPSGDLSQASPSASSISSMDSSVSSAVHQFGIKPFERTTPWKLNTKNFKDVLIRTYSTFAQIILSPSTTGIKNSVNPNLLEEFSDALKQLDADPECRAILVTGIGGNFILGVDYTILANDGSADKQRKSAEALANGIKKLIKQLLNTKKVMVAAVNGNCRNLGVSLLPYFDIVYANDKAEFSMEYARLGHMPEAAASQTKITECREMLILGHTLTATQMAQKTGLVHDVILPSKFLEEIVPKIESLEFQSASGLQFLSKCIKKTLRERVLKVIDEETKELINQWSSLEFAKSVKNQYIKSGYISFM